jgi:uncharacterized membrane protein YhiD involved in acid resistance
MIDLSATDVFAGMVTAFILSLILSLVLKKAARHQAADPKHYRTMVLLATVVSLIMAVIGNSLARAFGAIGALSLIRFRTAIKSSNELAYLFMAISVGMACGSGYLAIAAGATGLFIMFSVFLERFFSQSNSSGISMIKAIIPNNDEINLKLMEKIDSLTETHQVLSRQSCDSDKTEIIIEAIFSGENQSADLIKASKEINPEIIIQILLDQS